jgi:formamidopyrimidine-DNA glycosylase
MPELPEVEVVARGLRAAVLGRRLRAVLLLRPAFLRGDPVALAALEGAACVAVRRAGKYLVLDFVAGQALPPASSQPRWQLLLHLGMTGRLQLHLEGAARLPHTHAVFVWDDARELHFSDPRRFGRLALAPAPASGFAPALAVATGAEPLEVGAADFIARFHRRTAPIKSLLLNQKLLRGVGNIYADESLFRAGIDPRARAVSRPRLARLRLSLRAVLRQAIAAGGSSISDYVDSQGRPGWFHLRHRVYGRTGEPCRRCRTPIRRIVLGGRSSHFCPSCQRRY